MTHSKIDIFLIFLHSAFPTTLKIIRTVLHVNRQIYSIRPALKIPSVKCVTKRGEKVTNAADIVELTAIELVFVKSK